MTAKIRGVLPSRGEQPLWLAACDSKYALDHAPQLVRSIDANDGRDIHLHVINPVSGIERALVGLCASLTRSRLTLTFESVDLSSASPEQRITYYACSRFMIAPKIIQATNRPLIITDADAIVRKRLTMNPGAGLGLFLREDHPEHMRIAAGLVYYTPKSLNFAQAVGSKLEEVFANGTFGWYLDQLIFNAAHSQLDLPNPQYFTQEHMDWEFGDDSTIWTGKGPRKYENEAYKAEVARYGTPHANSLWLDDNRPRCLILKPRFDLPFKQTGGLVMPGALPPLRAHWTRFVEWANLAALQGGYQTKVLHLPMWQFTAELVDALKADVVLVPHKERHQFNPKTPALYYMQTPVPYLFTLDERGWGAGCKDYPFNIEGVGSGKAWRDLQARADRNESKFDQPPRRSREELVAEGLIPDVPFLFFPCQIPHDETIRFHSTVEEAEAIEGMAGWAREHGVPVVFKPHPVNLPSMEPLKAIAPPEDGLIYWSDASVHDLIAHSKAVFTINSGVGLEALIAGRPVAVFGMAEYDSAAVRVASTALHHIQDAYDKLETPQNLSRFFDWFVNEHTFSAEGNAPRLAERLASIME
jgi:hypothetical protein